MPQKEIYPRHVLQVNIYRWLVEPLYAVDTLEIVYMDMGGAKRLPAPIMDRRKVTATLVARARVLKSALDGGLLPDRVDAEGLWQCSWCSFPDTCWPKGIPTPSELRTRDETKLQVIRKARETKEVT